MMILGLVDLDIVKNNIKLIYILLTQCQVSASGPYGPLFYLINLQDFSFKHVYTIKLETVLINIVF